MGKGLKVGTEYTQLSNMYVCSNVQPARLIPFYAPFMSKLFSLHKVKINAKKQMIYFLGEIYISNIFKYQKNVLFIRAAILMFKCK